MRIFVFKSGSNSELRAFTDDLVGTKLPEKFRPWHATGVISPGTKPPHNLSRIDIEKAIAEHGFQLWRMKEKLKLA